MAAWLPGSKGGGVADVLIGDAAGAPRHAVTGRLSFSWPARPDQTATNVTDGTSAEALFPYGFGLRYGEAGALAQLRDDYAVAAVQGDVLLTAGGSGPGWTLTLEDAGGATGVDGPRGATPGGGLRWARADREAQEDTLALTWTGAGPAGPVSAGAPVDWRRQANGDVALAVTYRLDATPLGAVTLAVGCGPQCVGRRDVTAALNSGEIGVWRDLVVPLRCFADAGVDLAHVERPLTLEADAPLGLSLWRVGLAPSPGGAACPP